MNIANMHWSFVDYPEPNKSSLTIFLSGCDRQCVGCQNLDLSDRSVGSKFDTHYMNEISRSIANAIDSDRNLVIMGGEPLMEYNRDGLDILLMFLRKDITVCLYTSYDFNTARSFMSEGSFNRIKYIKTGRFDRDLYARPYKTVEAMQLASVNQEWFRNDGNGGFAQISKNGLIIFN